MLGSADRGNSDDACLRGCKMYQIHLCQFRHNRVGRTVEADFALVRGLVLSVCLPYTLLDIINGIDIQGALDRKKLCQYHQRMHTRACVVAPLPERFGLRDISRKKRDAAAIMDQV